MIMIIIVRLVFSCISFATTITTTKSASIYWGGTFTASSTAIWDYETGVYQQLGSWRIVTVPAQTVTVVCGIYWNKQKVINNYKVEHYFLPFERYVISGSVEPGPIFYNTHNSLGAH